MAAWLPVLAVLTALVAGCGVPLHEGADLERSVRDYTMRLRWSDWTGASQYFADSDQRRDFLSRMESLPDLRIVEVRVREVQRTGPGEAEVRLAVEHYLLPSATVRSTELSESWRLQRGEGEHLDRWQIVSPFPSFP